MNNSNTIEIFGGQRQVADVQGRAWMITNVSIEKSGYIPDVSVTISPAMSHQDELFDDPVFVGAVMDLLREAGYAGRPFRRAELGMQEADCVTLEPNAEFYAFAEEKLGWVNCEKLRPVFEAQADRLLAITQAAGRTPPELLRYVLSKPGSDLLEGDTESVIREAFISAFEFTGAATLIERISRREGIPIALEDFPKDPLDRPCLRPHFEAQADFLLDVAHNKARMPAHILCGAMRVEIGAAPNVGIDAIRSGLADRIEDEGRTSVVYDFLRATKLDRSELEKYKAQPAATASRMRP